MVLGALLPAPSEGRCGCAYLSLFSEMFLFESFGFHKFHPFIRVSALLDLSIQFTPFLASCSFIAFATFESFCLHKALFSPQRLVLVDLRRSSAFSNFGPNSVALQPLHLVAPICYLMQPLPAMFEPFLFFTSIFPSVVFR